MIERKRKGTGSCPPRKAGDGKERAAKQEHGRNEKEDGQIEHVNGGSDAREKHPDGAESQAPQESQKDHEDA